MARNSRAMVVHAPLLRLAPTAIALLECAGDGTVLGTEHTLHDVGLVIVHVQLVHGPKACGKRALKIEKGIIRMVLKSPNFRSMKRPSKRAHLFKKTILKKAEFWQCKVFKKYKKCTSRRAHFDNERVPKKSKKDIKKSILARYSKVIKKVPILEMKN